MRIGAAHQRRLADRQADVIEELDLPKGEMRRLLDAYQLAEGRITESYLARLALAYKIAARTTATSRCASPRL